MAIAAPTQLATVNSNVTTQSSWATGAITFPTTGTPVLGLMLINISGTATAETITVADNAGTPNTWTVVATTNNTGSEGHHSAIAYFLYPSAGAGTTVTVTATWGTAVNDRMAWCGYTTGHATTSPLDVTGTQLDGTAATTTSVTTSAARTANNDLGVWGFSVSNNTTGPTGFPPAGWTSLFNPLETTRTRIGAFAYQVTSGGSGSTLNSGTLTHTASSVGPAVMSIGTFKEAAVAAVLPPRMPSVMYQPINRSYNF